MRRLLNPRVLAGALMVMLILTFTPASALTSTTYEKDVITWTNKKRADNKLVAVTSQSCVDGYAEKQASWLASHRKLEHQNLKTILKACKLTAVSENIAYGYSSGKDVVAAWMRSPGHKANLLSPKMRLIGVGAVQDSKGVWWVSQVFGKK
jgi:uncharacterized protein YkwD